jgi:hypothetical protein
LIHQSLHRMASHHNQESLLPKPCLGVGVLT